MGLFILGTFVGVLAVGGLCWGLLYLVFLTNPDKQWRDEVMDLARSASRILAREDQPGRDVALAKVRVRVSRAVLEAMAPQIRRAGEVTLFRYLPNPQLPKLPAGVRKGRIPCLEEVLGIVEARTLARRQAAAVTPSPESVERGPEPARPAAPSAPHPSPPEPDPAILDEEARRRVAVETTMRIVYAAWRVRGDEDGEIAAELRRHFLEECGGEASFRDRIHGLSAVLEADPIDLDSALRHVDGLLDADERKELVAIIDWVLGEPEERTPSLHEFFRGLCARLELGRGGCGEGPASLPGRARSPSA